MGFGDNLRRIRRERGLTQSQLATIIGDTALTINRYERGERKPIEGDIARLAKALKVKPEELLDCDNKEQLEERDGKIGDAIAEILEDRGLSVAWLANESGIPRNTICVMIDRGSTPLIGRIKVLANALDMSPGELINYHSNKGKRNEKKVIQKSHMAR